MQYKWTYATMADAQDILDLSLLVQYEVDTIFNFDPNVLSHHIVTALVNQYYTGRTDLVVLYRDANNKLLAYTWVKTGEHSMWSSEEVAAVRMAHVDPNLSARQRIALIKDMLEIWERFAQIARIPIITSNTLRHHQSAFLRLHEQAGYIVRGSVAYKRVDLNNTPINLLNTLQTGLPIP